MQKTNQSLEMHVKAYPRVALVLQGGGALGSYQAGVIQGLVERKIEPSWVSGISIGAFNSAIVAGNKPEDRLAALRGFWEDICREKNLFDLLVAPFMNNTAAANEMKKAMGWMDATQTILMGQPGFFVPRQIVGKPTSPDKVSMYSTDQMVDTLRRHVDFSRLNGGDMRFTVGAVNIKTGNFTYFDNKATKIGPEHVLASGALPPGLPAVRVGDDYFWDGGLVSNTPLFPILEDADVVDTLVFQVDLWSSKGALPKTLADVEERRKDITYSSRTRFVTDMLKSQHESRRAIRRCLSVMTEKQKKAANVSDERMWSAAVTNIVHLIYQNKSHEGFYKDFEFSGTSMDGHWLAGQRDIGNTFNKVGWFAKPSEEQGFVTHDIHGEVQF
jgi:NTE family protein